MANITKRTNKDGSISYRIKVYKGADMSGKQLKPFSMTWKAPSTMTEKQIEKELNNKAVEFEKKCREGVVSDSNQTFEKYADYVINLKERTGTKHKTIFRYRGLLKRINEGIGYLKLNQIKPQHLNNLYEQLAQKGLRKNVDRAVSKVDLKAVIKSNGFTIDRFAKTSGACLQTLRCAFKGENINRDKAEQIADTLGISIHKLFNLVTNDSPLSNKTILEHHRLISTILNQAEKEMLIQYNPANKATPPKAEHPKINYFQPEDIINIRECLNKESLKWKTIVHLFLITGCRRGEIAGLKWSAIEWKKSSIHIYNNLLYTSDIGIYEDTTKTESSDRYVSVPPETIELLKEYRKWYMEQSSNYGSKWHNTNYLFFQEKSGSEGEPINPDTITNWCDDFSIKYKLPHINPHAFRHTMASLLYFNGADSVSISKRLGHSKVSTTTDIYSHIIKQAEEQNAELIANVILRDVQKHA